jgi:thiamine biosynthesis lipoprotein
VKPPKQRVNRREILRGFRSRPSADVSTMDSAWTSSNELGSSDLMKASRQAMGSFFEIRLPARLPGAFDLAVRALDLIDELESQLTIYRDDSEVSRLNASAHLGPVVVEPGLFGLLERAVELGRATEGAYDVTSGALSEAWGFVRGPKRVPDPETLAKARARTGFTHLTLNAADNSVMFDRPGLAINLGSIGKGYAIDRAAELIRGYWWPAPALIHGGQSSVYALGSPPDQLGGRWEVALRNPFDPSTPLGTIRLRNRALGTSGAAFQRFESNGRTYGHILDPRTGEPPVSTLASVTVLAPTAADADALSTAFYLLGPEGAARYIADHPQVGVIFVEQPRGDGRPRVHVLGLTEADFEDAALSVCFVADSRISKRSTTH